MPSSELQADEWGLPPLPEFAVNAPLSAAGRKCLENLVEKHDARAEKSRSPTGYGLSLEPLGPAGLKHLCDAIVTLSLAPDALRSKAVPALSTNDLASACVHELDPVQFVRLLAICGLLNSTGLHPAADKTLQSYSEQRADAFGLRELAAVFELLGLGHQLVGCIYLDAFGWSPALRWEPEAVWPYFAERLEALSLALEGRRQQPESFQFTSAPPSVESKVGTDSDRTHSECVGNALAALEGFPRIPRVLEERLWDLALGTTKRFRDTAQRILKEHSGTFERLLGELESKRSTRRTAAARWLADWGDKRAITPLRSALERERQNATKSGLMDSLEALDVPAEDFLSPEEITKEASEFVSRKGLPQSLAWVPLDQLPLPRWRRSRETVPVEVLAWWFSQAHRLKSPEPGALLRRQLELLQPEDRQALALALFESWMRFDTMPNSPEQALASARRLADRWERTAQYLPDDFVLPTIEELVEQFGAIPGGSAIKFKGLLAIPAACGGIECVELGIKYIREWYGLRAAQSKALVRMISWIDVPVAIQFLTATAKNFRTTGIREEAHQALHAVATRRGWTVDQLADRMVPDGGLDSFGELHLDFGRRTLVAELDPGFKLQVRTEEGKLLESLPKPGHEDDLPKAESAKKAFSKAKRDVRSVVKEQSSRLFEAMCSQRAWLFQDWLHDLHNHPIVGRLCRQVVWAATDGAHESVTFRPTGKLVNAAAEEVLVAPETPVVIAHDFTTPPGDAMPWLEHFENYAIEPLFPQFNRGLPDPQELSLGAESIKDFEGYLIQSSGLQNRARKLGYRKGDALDGPMFYDHRKSFPTLRIEVRLEFTGQEVFWSDRLVALEQMTFWQMPETREEVQRPRRLALGEVPMILLLEAFRELREVAESGEGFDPDWQERVRAEDQD